MKKGFYTALGTPLDENGNFLPESMAHQIELQIQAGVSGLLVMGSMGQMSYIKQTEYAKVAAESVKAVAGRVPVLIGVTDLSINRVMERVEALKDIDGIDGIVSTVPYYDTVTQDNIFEFYNEIANRSGRATYLYDLPVVTKTATTPDTVMKLWKNPNIKGIKSGNMVTQRILHRATDRPDDFTMMYSNLDDFDIAYKYGIDKNLDGMFACTPKTAQRMYQAMATGDYATGGAALDGIICLRNLFSSSPCLAKAFSHAMHLLGCEGNFAKDYQKEISDEWKEKITVAMRSMGEI
ncbi:MAG: dihydrodipicolinate synthase family protein [Lachnospiraceae bacterium]|nr:dihydrodipicolinate synthase family protein [Lachnospiraceae bacterium]